MQRDSIGLAWLKRSILATLIILFFTSGKATAGHGDADDAASFKSPGKSRFERLFGNEESEYRFDFKSLSRQAANALYESIRLIDCNLLNSDTLAIIHQDFEMRLCEWRSLESDSDAPLNTGNSQTFIAFKAIPNVPSSKEAFEEPAEAFTQIVTDLPKVETANEKPPQAKPPFEVQISAIESSIQVRPWGYRFTRDNLLSSYQFSRGLQVTKLYEEEYRPYDFFEVPTTSEAPVVAEVSSNSDIENTIEVDENLSDLEMTAPSVVESLSSRAAPTASIADSVIRARRVLVESLTIALTRAKGVVDYCDFDVEELLFERIQNSKPVLMRMSMTATEIAESFAYQHWLANGIKLAIELNSPAVERESVILRGDSSGDLAIDSRTDSSTVRKDLRKVFGASVLADPFAADCSLVAKRPPMLASPEMVQVAANEASNSEPTLATGEPANGTADLAPAEELTNHELLVILQNPSWMADAVDATPSKVSGSVEIGLSKVDEASEEPKSASLTPENAGIGISQR